MADTSLRALREHLFDVIERLKESNDPDADKKDTIDIETAKAINETAQSIINSAKVEVTALKFVAEEGPMNEVEESGILRLKK